MDPRHQFRILPRSLSLDQSSHVHPQEPQIDSRLVALKEVAEDITVYNILMTWPCGPGLMECIDDCRYEWYIQCRYFTAFSTKMTASRI
jgi:hypothetical protein